MLSLQLNLGSTFPLQPFDDQTTQFDRVIFHYATQIKVMQVYFLFGSNIIHCIPSRQMFYCTSCRPGAFLIKRATKSYVIRKWKTDWDLQRVKTTRRLWIYLIQNYCLTSNDKLFSILTQIKIKLCRKSAC